MSHTAGLEGNAVMGRSRVVARFDMGGKVLVQRAAEVDIHQLHTSADAEHGKIDLEGDVEKSAFVGIAMRVGVPEIRVGFLTELGWIDVIAAAEQEAIEAFEDLWTGIGRNPTGFRRPAARPGRSRRRRCRYRRCAARRAHRSASRPVSARP